ncbi:MAG: hypothetical protein ACI92E_001576, partial [Oceanicoccus sp.]
AYSKTIKYCHRERVARQSPAGRSDAGNNGHSCTLRLPRFARKDEFLDGH